ncbi:MAG: hypothetical protein QFX40_08585 [Archaeoglobales archaeon]|nr:hypothetical protein [Archaeoglobales archaeon]
MQMRRVFFFIGIFLMLYSLAVFGLYGLYLGKFYEIETFITILLSLGFALALSSSDIVFKNLSHGKFGEEFEVALRVMLFLMILLTFVLQKFILRL